MPLDSPHPALGPSVLFVIPAYEPDTSLSRIVGELVASGVAPAAILVVDDGSSPGCGEIFQGLREEGVRVLRHAVNLGKGQALKSAFNEALTLHPDAVGVVTLDADGQHAVKDALRVRDALLAHPDTLILGARVFGAQTPLRSRLGNTLTRRMFRFFTGRRVSDTQTGLRGIPRALLPGLLRIPSMRYDFEFEMLLRSIRDKVPMQELPIDTIYLRGNASSHFNPFLDSVKIYFVFIRFVSNSLLTALIDYIVFFSTVGFVGIFNATLLARLLAGSFNFLAARRFVFKDRGNIALQAGMYALLVLCHMTVSYLLIVGLVDTYGFNIFLSKVLVESFLYLANFSIQHQIIFRADADERPDRTDWDSYYTKKRGLFSLTRRITARVLRSLFSLYGDDKPGSVVELGGANSCFFNMLHEAYPAAAYVVVDNNALGLRKFMESHAGCDTCRAVAADVLHMDRTDIGGDVVYSVGLIEHFTPEGTSRAIRAHFRLVREGGLVIMTFPSPTPLYRLTRSFLELIGKWAFFDERPLPLETVVAEVRQYGEVLRQGYNPWILLTQGFVAVRATRCGAAASSSRPSDAGA